MNAPGWLPNLLAVMALVIAGYSVLRAVTARSRARLEYADRETEVLETDVLDAVLALALAAMLVHWMDVLPRTVWTVALNATGYWFAWRLIRLPRASLAQGGDPSADRAAGRARAGRLAASAAGSAIAVYMLLAGVAPAAAGVADSHVMAGMAGMAAGSMEARIAAPGLGVLFAAALAGYAAVALNQASANQVSANKNSAPGAAVDGARADTGSAALGRITAAVPRSVELCRVLLAVIMAYAIVAQLV